MLNAPTQDQIARLHGLAKDGGPLDAAATAPYLAEPRDRRHGHAATVLRPGRTEDVAAIVRLCAEARLPVIPYAGGTGLVGGQLTDTGASPVILSLERMNRVRAVLPEDAAMVVEAGVILADIQAAAADAGWLFPLSLAAEGSCRIGGNLATNAGGVQVLRYGNARDLCLGIEAVLPDGSVHHGLRPLRKDNTGYDLRHLLIGSEGTLGVITAATLRLFPAPGEVVTAMLAVPDPAAAVALLRRLKFVLGDSISAFELLARLGLDFVHRFNPGRPDPLSDNPEWRVLLEATGPRGAQLSERMEAALGEALERGLATDGAIAQSESQRAEMWWLRESIPEANRRVGAVSSHDISVPISSIARYIAEGMAALTALDPTLRINCFGHIGDGNLHYNAFPAEGRTRADYDAVRLRVKDIIHDLVHAHGGSISAEHGIGRLKTADLVKYGDPAKLAAMRAIKSALDPHGIMNPGAVIAAAAADGA